MMESVIELLREKNEPVPVPLALPDEDELVEVEEQLYLRLPRDYRGFLLAVSDVVYGSLEPATASDPHSHTYLPEMAASAWDQGVPRTLIPVCAGGNGYYCIDPDGEVIYWSPDEGLTEQCWPSIWHWAQEVWLQAAYDAHPMEGE